ncbi:MAG: hypothetical protein ABSD28_04045 [Tepidisphaeraceae bacterium]|jgi:hypothetical protein
MRVEEVLSKLKQLGAEEAAAPLPAKVNAHIHLPPNFSAFATVAQAVDLAAEQGVSVLGASNYYDYDVYGEFGKLALARGIYPLFGLEIIAMSQPLRTAGAKINDPGNPGKIYVCGKGITRFTPMNAEVSRLLGVIRKNDSARMRQMTAKVAEAFERHGVMTGLDAQAVIDRIVKRHGSPPAQVYLQERHVCQAFQERLFELVPAEGRIAKLTAIFGAAPKAGPDEAVKIQDEIRSHLMKTGKPAFVEESFLSLEEAYELIVQLGGIPCYPVLADGQNPVSAYEAPVERLIENLKSAKVWMAEFIPVRNSAETILKYVPAMRRAGFVVTAGTEHNTLELIGIEPTCAKRVAVPEQIMAIFREGACVVAAHQQLNLNGRVGFTDDRGQLNPAFGNHDERIRRLARIGAAAVARVAVRV